MPAPTPPVGTASAAPNPQLAASLLQAVAAQAQTQQPARTQETGSLTAPLHASTNPASFHALLRTHQAAVALFTSATCPPCRMIEPVFERLSEERGGAGTAFIKVDMGVGQGSAVASEWHVRVTPTFIFFLDGKKASQTASMHVSVILTTVW